MRGFICEGFHACPFFPWKTFSLIFPFSLILFYFLGKGVFGALENGMKQHTHLVQRWN